MRRLCDYCFLDRIVVFMNWVVVLIVCLVRGV